jgi:protein-disulfide isomerase
VGKQASYAARERRIAKAVAQQRARQRVRALVVAGGFVIVGLVVAIAVSLISAGGRDSAADSPDSQQPYITPTIATANGALAFGEARAPVKLEIYLDYMCPYCGRFERANSAELDRMVADGTVRIELYPLSFLDRMSNGTRYSTRAANAIATVAHRAPDKLQAFNDALFANQPAEGTSGLSDDQISKLARGAGVPPETAAQFTERIFEPWVVASTSAALNNGITATPTVKINGTLFSGDLYTLGPLTRAIVAAKGP